METIEIEHTPGDEMQDYILTFGPSGTKVGVKRLSFIPLRVYLWLQLGTPSKSLFRTMREELGKLNNVDLLINIEYENPVTYRFAEWFGFREVASTSQCLIMKREFN